MPYQGSLTPEQQKQIQDWLKENWKGASNCSVCLANSWNIAGHLVTPTILVEGGMSIGGSYYPQVMSICSNCGHTVYFNAMVMGIIKAKDKDKEQSEKKNLLQPREAAEEKEDDSNHVDIKA